MCRVLYSLACSLDGYIARLDRSADWLLDDQVPRMQAELPLKLTTQKAYSSGVMRLIYAFK